jgi:signal transduction histidine kinase
VNDPVVDPADHARFDQYLRINIRADIGWFVSLVVVSATIVPSGWIFFDAIIVGAVALTLSFARRLLARGHMTRALYVCAGAQWSASVITTAVTPFVLPLITVVILLPVVLMVPYLERVAFRRMIGIAIGVDFAATVVALVHALDVQDKAPIWVIRAILVLGIPGTVGLVALVAWQNYLGLNAQTLRLRESRSRVVMAADQERRRVERDLHDGTQQRLVALAVQVGLLRRIVPRDPDRALAMIDQLSIDLDEAMSELRNLAHGVYPPLLGQRGLVEALQAAAARSTLPATVQSTNVGRYDQAVETAVYFCCLEAMQNAAKHAGDASIDITIDGSHHLLCTVRDNGAGFDQAAVPFGHGFINMSDRVGAVGGTVQVDASPNAGTKVRIQIPVDSVD